MENLPRELNPPVRRLMGPGPSDVHPRVLAALAAGTVGHLDPYYLELMNGMQQMLRAVLHTQNEMTLAISGTGSAGMEAAVVNLIEPGDSMLVCVNGMFGGRMVDVATRAGANVTRIDRPWGQVFSPDEVRAAIATAKPRVVGIVMAETSTGAAQPIAEIARLTREAGALMLVDAVTALGGMPIETDAWQIDAIYSGTQKCLSCPPGLAPLSFSSRAMEKIRARKTKVQSWYLDVTMLAQYWGQERVYHHTAPINMTYGLYEGLLRLVLDEGLDACFLRHATNHAALKAGLAAIGIGYAADPAHLLPMLNAVTIPEGVDDAAVRAGLLQRFGIEIGGLGAFKGKVWRIGLMGHGSRQTNVLAFLAALEQLLAEQGHRFSPGASIAAANASYLA